MKKKIIDAVKIDYRLYASTNIILLIFIVGGLLFTALLRFMTVGNIFYIKPFLSELSFFLLLSALSYMIQPKKRPWYFIIVSLLIAALLIGNTLYYRFYTNFLSVSILSQVNQALDVKESIFWVFRITDPIYLLYPIIIIIAYIKLRKTKYFDYVASVESTTKLKVKTFLFAVITLLLFTVSLSSLEVSRLLKQWNRPYLVERLGLYTYHIADAAKTLTSRFGVSVSFDKALSEFDQFYNDPERPREWKKNNYTGKLQGRDVIAIHYESAMAFAMNLTFNGQEVTPNLNKLAKEGLFFNNFYAQESIGTSSDTEFTINSSLLPLNNGTVFINFADRDYLTIEKMLKEQGYLTMSMHANNGGFWNRLIMHKNLGYDTFYHKDDYIIDDEIGLGLSDESFYRQSVEKLKTFKTENPDTPYYATLITLTNHTPFSYYPQFGDFDVDYMKDTDMGDYLVSMHYADYALGQFIEQLRTEGLLENAVIMLYGDHDARQSRQDFNRLYNYDPETEEVKSKDDEGYRTVTGYEYQLLRKVPAIIWTDDQKLKPRVVDKTMGMYDLGPTLLNMLGLYNPYALGQDIFSNENPLVVFSNGNWIDDYVYYSASKEEYYPLKPDAAIPNDYVTERSKYANEMINVSEYIIRHNLIKYDIDRKKLIIPE